MAQWLSCPVCEGAAHEPFVDFPEQLTFVRCPACGVVYKRFEADALRPADFYERGYFHGRKSGRDRRFAHRVRKAIDWIRSALELHPSGPRSLLDVGCSFGYVLEAGRRLGLSAAGLDVSKYAVDACVKRGQRAEVGTLEKLPFADAEFDLVMMKHVLEHTPAPKVALAEVRRVLGQGGLAVIAVPNLAYWRGDRQRHTYRYFRPDDLGQQHYVYYTVASLVRLLEHNGFHTRVASKAFFRPRLAASSPWRRLYEPVRYAFLVVAMWVADALRMKRELFVIAQKS